MNNTPENGKKNKNIGKQKNLGMILTVAVLLLLVVVVVIVMIVSSNGSEDDPDATGPIGTQHVVPVVTGPEVTSPNGQVVIGPGEITSTDFAVDASGNIKIGQDYIYEGTLLVINGDTPYGKTVTFTPDAKTSDADIEEAGFVRPKKYNFSSSGFSVVIRKDAASALNNMFEAFCTASGVDKSEFVVINSYKPDSTASSYITGYSINMKIKDGESYFNFDHSTKKVTIGETEMTYEAWFKSNCAKYGFIYFGIGEFRYVGIEHADAMAFNKITDIKTYVDYIKGRGNEGAAVNDANGGKWNVRYYGASASGISVNVGVGKTFTVSGDNTTGFIVAVKTN